MAISKRVRFEVLKRDGFKCFYCGNVAADKPLTIDHVVPVALGGSDEVTNLVAACPDCNSGKSSVMPEAEMVARIDVELELRRVAQGKLMRQVAEDQARADKYESGVWEIWERHVPSYAISRLPDGLSQVSDWYSKGIPLSVVEKAVRIAVSADVPWVSKWMYANGVVRNTVQDAQAHLSEEEIRKDAFDDGYGDGFQDGEIYEGTRLVKQDFVALCIDQDFEHWAWKRMSVA